MSTDLEVFLSAEGLEQYRDVLESNHIGLALLRELSDADLKEIGIASLGHRRKLLAAVADMGASPEDNSELAPEPSSADVPHTADEDERIYVDKHVHLNGKETKLVVTSRRAIIGEKTYALQNITSVEIGDDAEEIAEKNKAIEKDNKPWDYTDLMVTLLTWFWAILLVIPLEDPSEVGTFHYVGAGFLFLVGLSAFSKTTKPLLPITYTIRVSAAGTVDNVLISTDHELVTEIVDALNTSIINLNM